MADGTIRLETRADNSKLGGDIAKSASKMKGLTNEFNDQVKALRGIENESRKVRENLDKIKLDPSKLASVKRMEADLKAVNAETKAIEKENAGLIASYEKAANTLKSLQDSGFRPDQLTSQIGEVQRTAQALATVDTKLDSSKQKAHELKQALAAIRMNPETSQEAQELNQRLQSLSGAANDTKQRMNEISGDIQLERAGQSAEDASGDFDALDSAIGAVSETASVLGPIFSVLGSAMGKAAEVGGNFGRTVRKGLEDIASQAIRTMTTFNVLGGSTDDFGKSLFRLADMLKAMVIRKALSGIVSGVQDGFQNLAQYSSSTNAAISSLMNSMNQLKNSFATAFAPILDVVAPILSTLINMLATAISYVSAFFAAITGKGSYTRAICTCGTAFQHIMFAINAISDTSRAGDILIYPRDTEVTYTLSLEEQYRGGNNKPTEYWSGVDVVSYNYTPGTETLEVQNGVLPVGQHEIRFSEPLHSLSVQYATILQSNANYALINVTARRAVTLIGKKYVNNPRIHSVRNAIETGETESVKSYEGYTLVNPDIGLELAESKADYFQNRIQLEDAIVLNDREVGFVVDAETRKNNFLGLITALDVNIRANKAEMIAVGKVVKREEPGLTDYEYTGIFFSSEQGY